MNRLSQIDPAAAVGEPKQMLEAVRAKLGVVPNMMRVLANSPAALKAYLDFSGALGKDSLGAKTREQIALAVAETNLCGYCLSAHSFIGGKLGLSDAEIANARRATAPSEKTDAILKLARAIVVRRGELDDRDLEQARSQGLTDGMIVETIANIALNIFTNYVNHIARTVIDFPEVSPGVGQ